MRGHDYYYCRSYCLGQLVVVICFDEMDHGEEWTGLPAPSDSQAWMDGSGTGTGSYQKKHLTTHACTTQLDCVCVFIYFFQNAQ